ncbi:hypothetical protein HanHA300_Chr12g0461261 [Helianthus annuus]|nr:hypothetical protein HanHA300_Chr12g0461261 [Helianthus annuus]KAJ0506838.1 hypothetical protein HanHA89_Chr12g0486661 [Helianthus annuus]
MNLFPLSVWFQIKNPIYFAIIYNLVYCYLDSSMLFRLCIFSFNRLFIVKRF